MINRKKELAPLARANSEMHIKHHDDLLDSEIGPALGRLLVAFQALEKAIADALHMIVAPGDPLDLFGLVTRKYSAGTRVETGRKVLEHLAAKFSIPSVKHRGRTHLMFDDRDRKATDDSVAQTFAGMRAAWNHAASLLQIRNEMVHGRLKIKGSEIQFLSESRALPSKPDEIEEQRQKVLRVAMALTLTAPSFRAAVDLLIQRTSAEAQEEK